MKHTRLLWSETPVKKSQMKPMGVATFSGNVLEPPELNLHVNETREASLKGDPRRKIPNETVQV